ncbi:MAG: endonuclease Q family protein [Nitrospirota bacterium]
MAFIADFHVHSRYSRATSQDMGSEALARWAELKGISLIGTGDFTHPLYFNELQAKLEADRNGLYKLKNATIQNKTPAVYFMLTAEVSNIFSYRGKLRKIHTLILAPSFDTVSRINTILHRRGNLSADGRPIFGFPAKDIVKMVLDVSDNCLLIPAHAWTPWFSIFGSNSGFDSIEECFQEETGNIYAIETGLSSDPAMNWRLSALDRITLLSNSDAHSPSKIGREANIFDCKIEYDEIIDTIKNKDSTHLLYTIEFFPEEGKYHFDGHRGCNILFSPKDTKKNNGICPVCKKPLTIGVMNRVEELADRKEGFIPDGAIPFKSIIPLEEIISEAIGVGVGTMAVSSEYEKMIKRGGSEFSILLSLPEDNLHNIAHPKVAEGIIRMRNGKVSIIPGYDGIYGKIKIFEDEKTETTESTSKTESQQENQMSLF